MNYSSPNCKSSEILVIGAGIVGLCAALAMRQRGYEVIIADKSASINSQIKRVYALNHASIALLDQLGVWQRLKKEQLSAYQHMHVWDQLTQATLNLDARLLAKSELGFIIEEQDLKQALLDQCHAEDLLVLSDLEITGIEETQQGVTAQTKQQQPIFAEFVLITDGAASKLRQFLNVPLTTWPYHQHAVVATIQTEKTHQHTAYQIFTPEGPLAFLPLHHPKTCSIVWSVPSSKAKALSALPIETFNSILAHAFENKLGACELISERFCFELKMQHAQQYVGRRWALMGDTAHTIHPLAGLGLNLGLADVRSWLNLLDTHQKCSSKMLGAYQRERKSEVWQVIGLMEGLKFIFGHPLPAIQSLRKMGVQTINHLTPLKHLIMGYAAGV